MSSDLPREQLSALVASFMSYSAEIGRAHV